MVELPRHVVDGVSLVIKFWTDRMYGFGDIAIFRFWQFGLKMRTYVPLGWFLGHIYFPQMMSLIVLTPKQKHGPDKVRISAARFELGVGSRNKDSTGQDRKKSQKVGGLNAHHKSKMAALGNIEKSPLSQQRFDRSPRNLARWRILTVLSLPTLKVWKSKLAVAAVLKNLARPEVVFSGQTVIDMHKFLTVDVLDIFVRLRWNLARLEVLPMDTGSPKLVNFDLLFRGAKIFNSRDLRHFLSERNQILRR